MREVSQELSSAPSSSVAPPQFLVINGRKLMSTFFGGSFG